MRWGYVVARMALGDASSCPYLWPHSKLRSGMCHHVRECGATRTGSVTRTSKPRTATHGLLYHVRNVAT